MLRTESGHEKSHIAKTRGWLAAYGEVSRLREEESLFHGDAVNKFRAPTQREKTTSTDQKNYEQ
jgi:hypothetical protein